MEKLIGMTVSGGIVHRVLCQLEVDSEGILLGSYVVIHGVTRRYIAQVMDTAYRPSQDSRFATQPVQRRLPPDLAELINSTILKPVVELSLVLQIDNGCSDRPVPAIALPPIHAPVYLAGAADIADIFGGIGQHANWWIGETRQGHRVPIDLQRTIQRSTAIYGTTGTGKSQFTKIVLAGLISTRTGCALIFDLHNDFAFDDSGDTQLVLPGLKRLWPDQVETFALGKNSKIRGFAPDHVLEISLTDITIRDVMQLESELALTDATPVVTNALYKTWGASWLRNFLRLSRNGDADSDPKNADPGSVDAWAKSAGVNRLSALALHAKLSRLLRPYVVQQPTSNGYGAIVAALKAGKTVIISFGSFNSDLDYLIVSTLIADRVCAVWDQDADRFRSGLSDGEPRHLVMVVEESHKFFNSGAGIFGSIARESRKFYIVLWISDQRPSDIPEGILSQIGTRIIGSLNTENDIDSAIYGLSGRDGLRRIVSSLRPSGEFLLAGWGVPTPIVLKSRSVTTLISDIRAEQNTSDGFFSDHPAGNS